LQSFKKKDDAGSAAKEDNDINDIDGVLRLDLDSAYSG
jgi:hypothetical protein